MRAGAFLLPLLLTVLPLRGQTVSVRFTGLPVVAGAESTVAELTIDCPADGRTIDFVEFSTDGLREDAAERLCCGTVLHKGKNTVPLRFTLQKERIGELSEPFGVSLGSICIDGRQTLLNEKALCRSGIKVRDAGDDGSAAYRIPGMVTTRKGTLIAVYDVRWNSPYDLQGNIDIGMSRSTDGGLTWEPMRIIMDMGQWGGLPQEQNGIGDPCILVDEGTGEIFVAAVWVHGIPGQTAWHGVGQGLSPQETGQLMLVSSKDDGLSWSEPRNITEQIKAPSWYLTLQGPGRGITMQDGTLVFPMQFIGPDRIPCASIMSSRDHGRTWQMGSPAKSNTTESQVVETEPGVLMLNMRDNRHTGRAVAVTRDLGRTWTEHPASGNLIEPVCMASIIRADSLLLFSNPQSSWNRSHISIRASGDGGYTWNRGAVLDPGGGWGYSCMSLTDPQTVGIIYESSACHLLYQSVKIKDIIADMNELNTTPAGTMAHEGYSKGVSAPFFGRIGKNLVLAGGANFPGKSLLEGGEKKVYREIFVRRPGKDWALCGMLPDSTAYGATFETPKGLVFAGGNVCGKATDKVYLVKLHCGKAKVSELPSLPVPLEQAGWAQDGDRLYLAGGQTDGGASKAVYSCSTADFKWSKIAELPEDAQVQPIAYASGGRLYVWCGFSPRTLWAEDKGWCLGEDGSWSPAPPVPDRGTFVGSSAARLADGRLVVTGGVNRAIFERALRNTPEDRLPYLSQSPGAYKFRSEVFIFDPASGWSSAGFSGHTALAGAGICTDGNTVYVAGGEIKPGVRSPEIFSFDL